MKKSGRGRVRRARRKKRSIWLFMFVLLIAFAASTALSYFYFKEKFSFESSFIAEIESRSANAGSSTQRQDELRLYESNGHTAEVEGGSISRKDALLVAAEDVIRKHLKPYRVRLLDLYMDKEGIIYIDIGKEIKRNFRGDAYEELKIIGELYKGIKSTVPGFSALKILIEGREAESFGGHIDISKPIGEEIAESIR
ncbi:MAG: hypothetical protein GXP46_04995 [Deferribacteres bacterium]|nr:hypothetical protein [Deferribacteres bacterium]